jgi:malate dehydrogenase (oxaloacetate-decarboxylating)
MRSSGPILLADVVERFHPTVLVGASGQTGAFTEAIVCAMHRHCARPIILPISNPTAKAEATPADILRWTEGAAVVGTGSPFPPVACKGISYEIGQGNNALIFPGVGLGAIAVGARKLTESAFAAASEALVACTPIEGRPGEPIYPPLTHLRSVSLRVAIAVGQALVSEGAAPSIPPDEAEARLRAMVWEPVYRPYRAAEEIR